MQEQEKKIWKSRFDVHFLTVIFTSLPLFLSYSCSLYLSLSSTVSSECLSFLLLIFVSSPLPEQGTDQKQSTYDRLSTRATTNEEESKSLPRCAVDISDDNWRAYRRIGPENRVDWQSGDIRSVSTWRTCDRRRRSCSRRCVEVLRKDPAAKDRRLERKREEESEKETKNTWHNGKKVLRIASVEKRWSERKRRRKKRERGDNAWHWRARESVFSSSTSIWSNFIVSKKLITVTIFWNVRKESADKNRQDDNERRTEKEHFFFCFSQLHSLSRKPLHNNLSMNFPLSFSSFLFVSFTSTTAAMKSFPTDDITEFLENFSCSWRRNTDRNDCSASDPYCVNNASNASMVARVSFERDFDSRNSRSKSVQNISMPIERTSVDSIWRGKKIRGKNYKRTRNVSWRKTQNMQKKKLFENRKKKRKKEWRSALPSAVPRAFLFFSFLSFHFFSFPLLSFSFLQVFFFFRTYDQKLQERMNQFGCDGRILRIVSRPKLLKKRRASETLISVAKNRTRGNEENEKWKHRGSLVFNSFSGCFHCFWSLSIFALSTPFPCLSPSSTSIQ